MRVTEPETPRPGRRLRRLALRLHENVNAKPSGLTQIEGHVELKVFLEHLALRVVHDVVDQLVNLLSIQWWMI